MRTVRSSSRLLRGVCPGGGLPGGVSHHALRQTPRGQNILDTRFWKYYLAVTSLRTVKISCSSVEYNDKLITESVEIPETESREDDLRLGLVFVHSHLQVFIYVPSPATESIHSWTRMHFSRMRTARSLTVSRSMQWGRGVCPTSLNTDPPAGCRPPDVDPLPGCRTPPGDDRCLWKHYLAPNFVCGR